MDIKQSVIDGFAPNPGAIASAKDLVRSGKYISLYRTQDGLLYFGECSGIGKNPYRCSVDFSTGQPVGRCSCPSRQIPCKHCVGLLQAALMGASFAAADVPEDIAAKRMKRRQTAEKAEHSVVKPTEPIALTKSQLSALQKKTGAQLEGIGVAAQLLRNMIQTGLGVIDVRMRRSLSGQVKDLGNYYMSGVQAAFNELLMALAERIKAGST